MSESFIIASEQKEAEPGQEGAALAFISSLLEAAHLKARRLQEVHWQSGGSQPLALQSIETSFDVALFQWPDLPGLDHLLLHSASRAILAGERELVLVGQEWQHHTAAALLASPAAVGKYNLLPLVRIDSRLTLPAEPERWASSLRTILQKRAQSALEKIRAAEQAVAQATPYEAESVPEVQAAEALPIPEAIHWLAASQSIDPQAVEAAFPQARRLVALPPAPPGAFFLLAALLKALENSRTRWGVLLSGAQQGAALATVIERF